MFETTRYIWNRERFLEYARAFVDSGKEGGRKKYPYPEFCLQKAAEYGKKAVALSRKANIETEEEKAIEDLVETVTEIEERRSGASKLNSLDVFALKAVKMYEAALGSLNTPRCSLEAAYDRDSIPRELKRTMVQYALRFASKKSTKEALSELKATAENYLRKRGLEKYLENFSGSRIPRS